MIDYFLYKILTLLRDIKRLKQFENAIQGLLDHDPQLKSRVIKRWRNRV